jgi:DNA-binding LytR/AlgR family response regulator
MPGDTGMDWLRSRRNPPLVIFTTAYAQHALEGFQLNAVDYLLKPVTAERFSQAAKKALELFTYRHPHTSDTLSPYIFVKENRQQWKVALDDILYIEGMLNYVIIHTEQQRIITYISMKNILNSLPTTRFLQVHRSFIVSLNNIRNVGKTGLHVGRHEIPVSRLHKPALDNWLRGKQLP